MGGMSTADGFWSLLRPLSVSVVLVEAWLSPASCPRTALSEQTEETVKQTRGRTEDEEVNGVSACGLNASPARLLLVSRRHSRCYLP